MILDRVCDIPTCLKEKKIGRVLIVTDSFLHSSGMLEPLKNTLTASGIGYVIYDEITPNPTVLNVETAREKYLSEGCQSLIGFGGGSAAGVKIAPVAFLVVKDGNVRVMPVAVPPTTTLDRVVDLVPEIMDKVEKHFDKKSEKEIV